jgi:hypothetical protein
MRHHMRASLQYRHKFRTIIDSRLHKPVYELEIPRGLVSMLIINSQEEEIKKKRNKIPKHTYLAYLDCN